MKESLYNLENEKKSLHCQAPEQEPVYPEAAPGCAKRD